MEKLLEGTFPELREGSIVIGRVLEVRPNEVIVDIGYKSEGVILIGEFEDEPVEPGDEVEILLERLENEDGMVVLSTRKQPTNRTGIRSSRSLRAVA